MPKPLKGRLELHNYSYGDLEPRQGEPTQTNRDYRGPRDHWGLLGLVEEAHFKNHWPPQMISRALIMRTPTRKNPQFIEPAIWKRWKSQGALSSAKVNIWRPVGQTHGPLLGPLNTRCRIILRTQSDQNFDNHQPWSKLLKWSKFLITGLIPSR